MLNIAQNDKGIAIKFSIYDKNGMAVDLNNCKVNLKIYYPGENIKQIDSTTPGGNLIILDPDNGVCQYTIKDEDTAITGNYNIYVAVVSNTNSFFITSESVIGYTVYKETEG